MKCSANGGGARALIDALMARMRALLALRPERQGEARTSLASVAPLCAAAVRHQEGDQHHRGPAH